MNIYLRVQFDQFPGHERPDEFVGPFPHTDIAVNHRLVYGPPLSRVVRLDGDPDPTYTMSPGQAVDYSLARY